VLFNLRPSICVVLKTRSQFSIKSGVVGWMKYVARMGEMARRSKGRERLEYQGVRHWGIIFERMLQSNRLR
jgi:hypothetical protein